MDNTTSNGSCGQGRPDRLLRELAQEFVELNREMGNVPSGQSSTVSHRDDLTDAQSEIIRNALKIQASDLSGVLAKMSIWVADAPDILPQEKISRCDAILLSAYSDLAEMERKESGL